MMRNITAVVVVVTIFVVAYQSRKPQAPTTQRQSAPALLAKPEKTTASTHSFTCDGRTTCSQMTSCEEATYFLQNCPNTMMDGDHNGIPCEQQWCRN
jgi:hypothetical protein